MKGITMDELYDYVHHNNDIEFEYNGTTYILQREPKNNEKFIVIWDITPDKAKCIARVKIFTEYYVPNDKIDLILSEKCFNGKSFLDIEKDVEVTYIS